MSTADHKTDLDATFEDLMKLAPKERLELGERLLESVPPPDDDKSNDEWKQEIEHRVKEYESDPNSIVPAEEVDRNVGQRIEEIRRLQDVS